MRHLLSGLRALVNRRQLDRDLDDELRSYVEAAVDRNLASSMSAGDALRAARISAGNLEAIGRRK